MIKEANEIMIDDDQLLGIQHFEKGQVVSSFLLKLDEI